MPGVIPFIPLIAAGAGMVAGNAQNKSNQAAATSASDSAYAHDAAAQQQAQQYQQQQQQASLGRLSSFLQSNPSPISQWSQHPVVGPMNTAPSTIGGGTIGPNGMPLQSMVNQLGQQGPQGNPQMMSMLLPALQQLFAQRQAALAPPPPSAATTHTQPVAVNPQGDNPGKDGSMVLNPLFANRIAAKFGGGGPNE